MSVGQGFMVGTLNLGQIPALALASVVTLGQSLNLRPQLPFGGDDYNYFIRLPSQLDVICDRCQPDAWPQ